MMSTADHNPNPPESRSESTQWSIVLAASDADIAERRAALAELCQSYWQPLFAFVRKRAFDFHAAQDITQDFFAMLFSSDSLSRVSQEHSSFRAFLLVSMRNFISNWRRDARAQKRGGQFTLLSLDFHRAEEHQSLEPFHAVTPEKLFEYQWARSLIAHALDKLRAEYEKAGKKTLFEILKPTLIEQESTPYRELAQELNLTEGAIKVAIHRLRRRYGDQLREEIARTLKANEELEEEIQALFRALRLEP